MEPTATPAPADGRRLPRRTFSPSLVAAPVAAGVAAALFLGCITRPQNPAATQPATALDPATTQPGYWLARPAVATVDAGRDFDAVWHTAKDVARGYLFALDREDYRDGVITTAPMISKQIFEFWRPDTGTAHDVMTNAMSAMRRTLRIEIDRRGDGTYAVTPKVLVERESVLERHVTDVSQYRYAFAGPGAAVKPKYAIPLDPETPEDIPAKYWYPVGRDLAMERQVAARFERALAKAAPGGAPASPAGGGTGTPQQQPRGQQPGFAADGSVVAVGPSQTVYINLGAADKIVPGMTFEVFEPRATIPPVDRFAADNPGSKGWVEVLSVANTSATCRVVKATRGTTVAQGDQVFNFVFERGRQNRFALAGEFAPGVRDAMSGLIWRWNGVVDEQVFDNTTYLIVGRPPTDAAAVKAYDAARAKAQELGIPILDEDRFNLLIRYYDPSKR